MTGLDGAQLARLLRDLHATAAAAAQRAAQSARTYLWLRARLRDTDVSTDRPFQDRLCTHFAMRGKLRARRSEFFAWFDSVRTGDGGGFDSVLVAVSRLTGQVEKSVASQALALLDPQRPVIDRGVRELLPRYGFEALGEAPEFDACTAYYRRLDGLFAQALKDPRWAPVQQRFDAELGDAADALHPARKLYLLLSHSRRLIALLPALQRQPVPAVVVAAADPAAPKARLHLCR
ncbi:MAG TPA: hypothetical protein VM491_06645 [Burkholderiaceae bacterium]|nr:hypothetical protein [Burkholderiaceae bacterium]